MIVGVPSERKSFQHARILLYGRFRALRPIDGNKSTLSSAEAPVIREITKIKKNPLNIITRYFSIPFVGRTNSFRGIDSRRIDEHPKTRVARTCLRKRMAVSFIFLKKKNTTVVVTSLFENSPLRLSTRKLKFFLLILRVPFSMAKRHFDDIYS